MDETYLSAFWLRLESHSRKVLQQQFLPRLCRLSIWFVCFLNEWMNEWMVHLYSALLCISVHPYTRFTIMWGLSSTTTSVQHPLGWYDGCHRTTAPLSSPHTSYRWRGERDIETIKCMLSPHTSYRWRGERDIETIKCMRSPHTSYRWRGERVIESIKWMRSPHTSYRWRGERVIETIKCMR